MQNHFRDQIMIKMPFRLKIGPDLTKLWNVEVGSTSYLGTLQGTIFVRLNTIFYRKLKVPESNLKCCFTVITIRNLL